MWDSPGYNRAPPARPDGAVISSRVMNLSRRFALLAALAIPALLLAQGEKVTALDRYVKTPDPSYKWEVAKTYAGAGYTTFVIDMTSQTWKPPVLPDQSTWRHWLIVVKPDVVKSDVAFLYITGGSNRDPLPEEKRIDPALIERAMATGSVSAELRMVPNQPINFPDQGEKFGQRGGGMYEDEFIAYTWDRFLKSQNEMWPARLPMTKASVRGMDTISALMASDAGGNYKVEKFFVAGGSKRGWTTWTTAAVDPRVIGISPIVIDLLNVEPSFVHHYRAYGFWAPAVRDYENRDLMGWSGTPEYKKLMKIVEPFEYRNRLTMPKFIVNSAGDQFFLPDSSQFYFDELKGEKYLRYVPNSDHSLRNTDARESIIAYYDAMLRNQERPKFTWKFEDDAIRVTSETRPVSVKVWQATNADARDFRLEKIGPAYQSSELAEVSKGVYLAKVPKPAKGWTAYFVELTFASGGKYPFKFTTPVRVTPDVYPFPAPKSRASAGQ